MEAVVAEEVAAVLPRLAGEVVAGAAAAPGSLFESGGLADEGEAEGAGVSRW